MVHPLLLGLFLACAPLPAADKNADKLLDVLRDFGGIEDHLKAMQKSLEAELAAATRNSADQARAAADQTSKALAAMDEHVQKSLQDQQDRQSKTLAAVAAVGSQVQALSGDLATLREAVSEITLATARLATQLNDLTTAVKAVQEHQTDAASQPAHPELSATDLFAAAEGDRLGGKFDLALLEYTDYVAKFAHTGQAVDAQYYIGSIHFSNQEWEDALKAFDAVAQNYPDNRTRMPAALFYKADALNRLDRGAEAQDTLKELRKRFPSDPLSRRTLTIKPPHFP